MRRSFVIVFLVCLTAAVPVLSHASQKNTGCGLGSVIFKGQDALLFQILAVTTNGTSGNQTFGITTGTLNCDKPSKIVSLERLNNYVADNMDNLAHDIAQGDGEYLHTLAVLMEVPETERQAFYSRLRANFSSIYTSPDVTSAEVLDHIGNLM